MARIGFTIPDERVDKFLEVFALVLHGPSGSGFAPKITLADIGAYYERDANQIVRQHEINEVKAMVDGGIPDDVTVPLTLENVDKEYKRRQKERADALEQERKRQDAEEAAAIKAAEAAAAENNRKAAKNG